MRPRPRILVVGHDAWRAGAQLVLLHVLRWMTGHTDFELSLVLDDGGDLLRDYEAVLPTTVLPTRRGPFRTTATSTSRLPHHVKHRLRTRSSRFDPGPVDLIYANTLTSTHLAARLAADLQCPAVCHVHELERSILRANDPARLREAQPWFERYIAVSHAVEENLVARHGIDRDRIDVIPACIPLPRPAPDAERAARLRAELGIPPDAFVVGGCGTADWRKGPDLFLLTAKALQRRGPSRTVHFVWVGGDPRDLEFVQYDRERLGLAATVHLVGHQSDPAPAFGMFDAFLLSSREDPFPLVCLEAAADGAPIVCFDGAGGMPDFVESDAGYVVPYLDVDAAADRLADLADDDATRVTLGARAAGKVAERCSVDVVGPEITAVLDKSLR